MKVKIKNKWLVPLSAALFSSTLFLAPSVMAADSAVSGRLGTLGAGIEYERNLSGNWNGRIGYNAFNIDRDLDSSGVEYEAELDLSNINAIIDYHPGGSSFRISGGVSYNGNKVSVVGVPTGGSFDFNNTTYTAADVGSLTGDVEFNKVAPYLGIGWGNAVNNSKWAFSFDLGVLFSGDPEASLTVECNPLIPVADCASLQSDVDAEVVQFQDDLDDFKAYPVIMLGVSYKL